MVSDLISINDVALAEGDAGTTLFVFTVTRTSGVGIAAVDFVTAPGSADDPGDYNFATGSVVFADGELTKTVTVGVRGDTNVEPDQDFFVNLSNPLNAMVADGQGQGLIVNDDTTLPKITVNDVAVIEGNAGTKLLTFSLDLSTKSSSPISVHFATSGQTATAGSDFVGRSGTAVFSPFQVHRTITIEVKGDTTFEPDETFLLLLSAPTNATIADGTGVGTIRNDDAAPPPPMPKVFISVNDESDLEGNSGLRPITFKVWLDKASTKTVGVHFATANGTATAGSDFNATSGTVTFGAGQTQKLVTVYVKGDTLKEADESFFVNLTSPMNALIAKGQGKGVIKNDD